MSPPEQEQEFLLYGDEAVEQPIDSVLDDSAAAEPMKRDKKKKRGGKKPLPGKLVLVIANGYGGYDSTQKEIDALTGGFWLPHNEDFRQTAAHTRNKVLRGASTADEFFGGLQSVKGKISRIVFIGHGTPHGLGLSGTPLSFFDEMLDADDIARWQANINASIKPKLTSDAKIDLIACNLAVGRSFMGDLASALGVCVRAFSEPVLWCTTFDKSQNKILSRGPVGPKSAVEGKRCSDEAWFRGVNKLVPPVEVCP